MFQNQVKIYCLASVFAVLFLSCQGQQTPPPVGQKPTIGVTRIPSKGLFCGYLDSDGTLWFGSTTEGVFSFDGSSFTNYTVNQGLCDNKVSCITEDNQSNLWFGTAQGLCRFDGKTFTHIPIPKDTATSEWLDNSYPIVNPNEVLSILQDKKGGFWLGSNGAGVYYYNGATFTNYLYLKGNTMPDGRYHNIIPKIVEDYQGNIWFASMSHGGITKYDGRAFIEYGLKDGLSDDMVRAIFKDKAGNLWFGFNGNRNSGLTTFNGQSFSSYNISEGLCNTNIWAIEEDRNGNLWLGSGRGNLCIFDGKSFTEFVAADGSRFAEVLFILRGAQQNIVFGGKHGLWKYNGEVVVDMLLAQ